MPARGAGTSNPGDFSPSLLAAVVDTAYGATMTPIRNRAVEPVLQRRAP
jgi:hypothetical protein